MKSFSCFKPKDPFRNWSKELDKRVTVWAQNFDSSFKLLLLGPAGAGKTTIMKQMKIIHFEGFTLEERQQKAKEIRANLLESVRELTACITASGNQIDWCDKENQNRLDFINGLNLDDQTYDIYAAKIYDYSKRILTDKGVERLFAQLNQLSITHRSQYLLNRVDEIRNVNYIPNNDDILQSRRRTSDIQKLEFQVKLPVKAGGPCIQQTFCMFDVGGQRGERRKWIQVFDGVSAVMFLIDSSGFDAIDEENGRNKLKETINLFYEVWTTRFLLNSNFVLLFNKQDILREKIERGIKIEDHFPEYKLYKFQPTDRHLNRNRASDKLNLFRTSSNRSTRSSSTNRGHFPPNSGASIAETYGDVGHQHQPTSTTPPSQRVGNQQQQQQQHQQRDNGAARTTPATPATKRKSASLYLFGTSSSRKSKSSKLPPDNSSSSTTNLTNVANTTTIKPNNPLTTATTTDLDTLVDRDQQHQQSQPSRAAPDDAMPSSSAAAAATRTEATTIATSSSLSSSASSSSSSSASASTTTPAATTTNDGPRRKQQQDDHDRETANHLAYIKARSFIRDKFIQITRQVDQPTDQRKFSSPNLPLYRTKSGTIGRAGSSSKSSSRIDRPKRNVCYHYTTATDTENIRDLFENLQKMVLKSTMKDLI